VMGTNILRSLRLYQYGPGGVFFPFAQCHAMRRVSFQNPGNIAPES
jgi:hypothetical protein